MSYNNNLQDNNAELQAILNTVNALPSGGKIEAVNILPTALTPNDITTIFDGKGYKNGYYASEAEPFYNVDANFFCTGLMVIPEGRTFYIKGCTIDTSLSHTRFGLKTEANAQINCAVLSNWGDGIVFNQLGEQYYSVYITPNTVETLGIPYYFWFSASGTGDNVFVSTTPILHSVGVIPSYWQAHIDEKVATVKALQDEGGKDCFSFIVMADTHYPSNLGKKSPILAKHILDKCDIRYALLLGDAQTRGCHNTKELLLAENVQIEEMLSPIRDRLLQTEGNHDGSYGWLDRDGDGKYDNTDKEPAERESYVYNLTPAELHSAIYRKVGLVGDVHFDESGSGYYIDDVANKVRYIILNTQCNKYELQADGTSKYPKMWLMNFTQPQHDLVIEALNSIPYDSWGVVVAGHCPLFQEIGDRVVMQGVLNAYANKTTYVGNYAGVAEADALYTNQIPISTDIDGNIVGLQKGYRYNSSDVLVAAEGVDATGFIPVKTGDVVRFKNIQFRNETINSVTAGSYYLRIYDNNYTVLNGQSGSTIADYWHYLGSEYTTDTDGNIASIKVSAELTNAAYMRIAFVPVDGKEAIITVNEEIVSGENSKNLAEPLPDNTTDTTKWVNGYRFSSTGISAQNAGVPSTLSNEIPIKFGDVIRIKGVTLREDSDRWALTLTNAEGKIYTEWQYFDKNLTSGVVTYLTYEGVENGVYTYRITSNTIGNTPVSFRIAFPTPTDASAVVITINEFEGSGSGIPYDAVSVNCDFSKAKGQLIGYFHGHTHVDSDNTTNGVKNIGTRCDAREENTEELRNERVEGTITEQSFNVFTVNKKTRKIYATKVGAGNNREINY